MMETGLLLKGIGGFYYVLCGDELVTCKAKGSLRHDNMSPRVGDRVSFEREDTGFAKLVEILPRKNLMLRPLVANIDRLMIVLSASVPAPDWLLADRLIVQALRTNVEPILLLNKCDCADEAVVRDFDEDYAAFKRLKLSALTGEAIEGLRPLIEGKVCCFAGQSAVGKSSILNALLPELELPTGELTQKIQRGKHTTRHAELWQCFGGAVLDTPGFSLYESDEWLTQQDLDKCYPEFAKAEPCRFSGCRHITEPDCGVKDLLDDNGLTLRRYERYKLIAEEFDKRRKQRYD